jgi:hypothetical protein
MNDNGILLNTDAKQMIIFDIYCVFLRTNYLNNSLFVYFYNMNLCFSVIKGT